MIINYGVNIKNRTLYKPFPSVILNKWKFLQPFINGLLKKLNSQVEIKEIEYVRVTIDTQDIYKRLQLICVAYRQHTGRKVTHVILGNDALRSLNQHEICKYMHATLLQTEEFLGYKLILNPFVDGIIPIDL